MYKPVTSKVDFPKQENEILHFWEEHQVFEKVVAQNRGNPRWSFIDGPITANNPMGVHHAWGRTYKDVFQRFKAMRGFDQRYQNGFDCQGLWVEVEVEKALGLNSKRQIEEYGLQKFVEACRDRVLAYAGVITRQSIRLGQWEDWGNSYFTMTDNNIEHIWYFLKRCFENGWLYKGWRTMPWCARCGTSLSQHELIGTDSYRDVTHPSVYVKLPILGRENEYFLVWTTTPWTLAANVALAVHPELDYARVETDGGLIYMGAKTLGALQDAPRVTATLKGSELVGWTYRGPWDELEAQRGIEHHVVPWEDVGEEEGTGIVHIAPGCGAEDFALAQKLGLPVIVPIDEDGTYYQGFGPLTGIPAQQAAQSVFVSLDEKHMLYKVDQILHRYPCCWRCGEEIVFRGVSEWFISCDEIRPRMIEAARTVEWQPASVGKRMEDWLNNMGDWCISRKRYWGLPLPFYPCPKCEKLTVVGSMDELRQLATGGVDKLKELHRPWIDAIKLRCPNCGEEIDRITEVGDCWLDAGIVPFSTIGNGGYFHDHAEWEKWYPANWISEMREQVRLWFYSMLFMSVALEDRAPYERVLSYEKLMDEHGRPMHKSLGNAIWFEDAAERMGADVMRWLYSAQNLQRNLLFGYGPAEEVRRKLLTLWNVYSFFVTYAEADQWHPVDSPRGTPSKMDRWILGQLDTLVTASNQHLEEYDTVAVVDAVDAFVDDLSNWYVRRGRRRFVPETEEADRSAAFATLYECLVTLSRVLAPFMPFLSEEIYQNLVRSTDPSAPESVHLTRYPQAADRQDERLALEMQLARAIVGLGRAARGDAGIGVRQPLATLTVAGELAGVSLSDEVLAEIEEELNVKSVRFADNVEGLARRIAKPNPRVLGPKLGPRFPEVNRALQAGDYQIRADGTVAVGDLTLTPQEVTITLEPLENQILVQNTITAAGRTGGTSDDNEGRLVGWRAALAASLDREVTPELRAAGLARDVIRRVQLLRRDAGLHVGDRIVLGLDVPAELQPLIEAHQERIQREVGATAVHRGSVSEAYVWRGELDGHPVALSLELVG